MEGAATIPKDPTMFHNSGAATASDGRKKGWRFFSPWIIGGIAGELFWGLAILGAYFFEAFESSFPRWFLELDLADTFGSICAVVAAPVAIGGWLFIWRDGPQPPAWVLGALGLKLRAEVE